MVELFMDLNQWEIHKESDVIPVHCFIHWVCDWDRYNGIDLVEGRLYHWLKAQRQISSVEERFLILSVHWPTSSLSICWIEHANAPAVSICNWDECMHVIRDALQQYSKQESQDTNLWYYIYATDAFIYKTLNQKIETYDLLAASFIPYGYPQNRYYLVKSYSSTLLQ
jgi:hypothetical protein